LTRKRVNDNQAEQKLSPMERFELQVIHMMIHCEPLHRIDDWSKFQRAGGFDKAMGSRSSAMRLAESLACALREKSVELLDKTPVHSLSVDESSSLSNAWQNIQMRVCSVSGEVSTGADRRFCYATVRLHEGQLSARGMFSVISQLKNVDWSKVYFFGTDGAAAMKLLASFVVKYLNPFLIWRWCALHRCQVALRKTIKSAPEFEEAIKEVNEMNKFVRYSTNIKACLERYVKRERIQIEDAPKSLKEMTQRVEGLTRWTAIVTGFSAVEELYHHLYKILFRYVSKGNTERKETMRRTLRYFADYRNLVVICSLKTLGSFCVEFHESPLQGRTGDFSLLSRQLQKLRQRLLRSLEDNSVAKKTTFRRIQGILHNVSQIPHLKAMEQLAIASENIRLEHYFTDQTLSGEDIKKFVFELIDKFFTTFVEAFLNELEMVFDNKRDSIEEEIIRAFDIFVPSQFPRLVVLSDEERSDKIKNFGTQGIESFQRFYGVDKKTVDGRLFPRRIIPDLLMEQWRIFVADVLVELYTRNDPITTYLELMAEIRQQSLRDKSFHKKYSEVIFLTQVSETIIDETVDNERSFNFVKMIYTPFRSRLTADHVDDATLIAVESRRLFRQKETWNAPKLLKSLLPRARVLYKEKIAQVHKRKAPDDKKSSEMNVHEDAFDSPSEDVSSMFGQAALDETLNTDARKALFEDLDREERAKAEKRRIRGKKKLAAIQKKLQAENADMSDDDGDSEEEMESSEEDDFDFVLSSGDSDSEPEVLPWRKSKRKIGPPRYFDDFASV
jgi:hypothetical protein